MKDVIVVENEFVKDGLSYLRDKNTSSEQFRFYSDRICEVLISQALQGVVLKDIKIKTPLVPTTVEKLSDDIIVIPIFRAGIAMLWAVLKFIPKAKIGFVGLARDEKTAQASEYYWNVSSITDSSLILITDPMLATGGSVLHVLKKIPKAKEIRVVCVIAAPEGINAVHSQFPEVKIITAAIDEKLNSQKYILPGLGDYGDRYFGS